MSINNIKRKIIAKMQAIVTALKNEDYQHVLNLNVNNRLDVALIQNAIKSYPGNITIPPESAYQTLDLYKVQDKSEWIVEFFLWINDEPSDLMLKVIFTEVDDKLTYNLWDIYVP